MEDEKEQKVEVKIKTIKAGGSWEDKANEALTFINSSNNIENMSQLIDITPSLTKDGGEILIYYHSQALNIKGRCMNSPKLCCETNRANSKSHLESAEMIKQTITSYLSQERLFKINHSRQFNKDPITFIWSWSIKPKFMLINKQKQPIYDETDHILRNHGNNVAITDKCCTFNKSVVSPMNIFQSGYDVNKHSYVKSTEIFQINFDRAYILNTLKFWLYDGDNRVYKYKIEVSKNETSWQQIANHQNKASWQTVQFDQQFVKHIRFIEGSNTSNQYIHFCRFFAFFDYSISFLQ